MNLLITNAWIGAPEHLDEIRAMGHELVYMPNEKEALPVDPAWVEGIVCNSYFLPPRIGDFVNLRYIQVVSAGLDLVPMDEVKRRGIRLMNARGVYSEPMAEHSVWAVLTLYRQRAYYMEQQAGHVWKKLRFIPELAGKTVCVVGCGSVGAACAARFGGMGCRVVGLNRTPRENPAFEKIWSFAEEAEALGMADIVVVTIPLNEDTRHLMNADRLAMMKEGAILVNVARGPLVDTGALIAALDARLGGAALDVFETEPLPADSPLWDRPDVLITPHNSFQGENNKTRLDAVVMGNLKACSE